MAAFWAGKSEGHPIFAPPVLKQGELVLSQTAAICHFLGRRHGLAPPGRSGPGPGAGAAAHDRRPRRRGPRHPSSHQRLALLRGSAARGEAACGALREGALAAVPPVLRARARVTAGVTCWWERACRTPTSSLFQALEGLAYAFPRGFALASETTPGVLAAPRAGAGAAAYRGLPGVGAPDALQPGGHLSALPGARRGLSAPGQEARPKGARNAPISGFEGGRRRPKHLRNRPGIPLPAVRSRNPGARGHAVGTHPASREAQSRDRSSRGRHTATG